MASVTSTITEDFLTCSICLEIFTDPKTLPCLHSFCKDCVNNLTVLEGAGINSYHCPICRESFHLPKGDADDLKTNFCLKNLINFVTSTKKANKICSFCRTKGENNDATALCLTCNDLLCSECADHRHRSTTLTLHHRVVPLAEVTAGKYNDEIRSKQKTPCSKHEEEDLRFFCETCDVPVCRDCIVLGHQNHKCLDPSDARKNMEDNLYSLMCSLNKKVKMFQNAKGKVVSAQKKIEVERKKVADNLEKQIDTVIKNLTESKMTVENEFNNIVKSKQDFLHQQEEYIDSEGKVLNETHSFCTNILRCGSDIEILSMKTEIKERLSRLRYSNDKEMVKVNDTSLPKIQFCSEGNVFKMVDDKEPKIPTGHGNDGPIGIKGGNNGERASKVHKDQPKTLSFSVKDDNEPQKPLYTSVAWVDEDTIAVVDQRNQKLKLILRGTGVVKTKVITYCITVCSFTDGLACRTEDSTLYVFNSSLELKNTLYSVSALLTSYYQSKDVFWIYGLTHICRLRGNDVKEIAIHSPSTISDLGIPMFGHVLLNGMFAVSDWEKCCVFIIGKSGNIEIMKYIGSKPGSISSDSDNTLYVCDFQRSLVVVLTLSGNILRRVKIGDIAPNPRSIAIKDDQKALIANENSIVEVDFNGF